MTPLGVPLKTRKRVTLAIFSHGDVAQRIQSTSLRTRGLEVRILPSSPNFKYGDECKASSGQYFKLDLAGSSPAFPANTFRGRLIGRTAGSEPVNRGSNPFPEAILSGRSTEAIWACFGNKCSQVRILLPGPFLRRDSSTGKQHLSCKQKVLSSNLSLGKFTHAWPNRQRHRS